MDKSRITLNAILAIAQVVIVGIVYLILYKYILTQIGIKLLGVWSLVVATTSVGSLANFGISSSIVKFVSIYITRERTDLIIKLIFTSLIFVISTYSLFSIILYFFSARLLNFIFDDNYVNIAIAILPFSLISLIINAIIGVFTSAIDGIQKNFIKSYIVIFSTLVFLILSIFLTPKYGIFGIVYAQIFQSVFVLTLTIFNFKKIFRISFNFRWNWDTAIFKEILNYGLKVQVASILEMTFEPVTKFLLSKFGGLTMVGYYEMATKLLVQLRSLIVSAAQVTIPVIAESKESNPNNIKIIYIKSFSIVFYLNILLTTFLIVSAPVISLMWIGHYESIFVYTLILSSLSMFFNISSTPAYFNFMGQGKLNWIVVSILIGFLLNVLLGYILGVNYGGIGVIIAFQIALILQAIILIFAFHYRAKIKLISIVSKNDIKLFFSSVFFMIFSSYMLHSINNNYTSIIKIIFCILSLFLFIFFLLKNQTFKFLKIQGLKLIKGGKI